MDDHIPPSQFELCSECNRRLEELMKSLNQSQPTIIQETREVAYDD